MFCSPGPAKNGSLPPNLAKLETIPQRSQLKQPLTPYLVYTDSLSTGSGGKDPGADGGEGAGTGRDEVRGAT